MVVQCVGIYYLQQNSAFDQSNHGLSRVVNNFDNGELSKIKKNT